MRTARSRISGEKRFDFLFMAPSSQSLEPPQNPGGFTRDEARSEVFDYIEGFYNRVRRHKHLDQLSPHEFERQRQTAL